MSETSIQTPKPKRRRRIALYLIVGFILWLRFADFPEPPSAGLDASWQAMLTDAHIDDRQFGKELIFTFGPWGWVNSHHVVPDAFAAKLLWEFTGRALICATVVLLGLAMPAVPRWCFLAAVFFFGTFAVDTLVTVVIVLAALHWLFPGKASTWPLLLTVLGLAFLAQLKFTFTLLALLAVALAVISTLWEKKWLRGISVGAGYAAAYLLTWVAAGQDPGRLQGFWRHSMEISRGYVQAMSLPGDGAVLLLSIGILAAGFGYALVILITHKQRSFSWPAVVLIGGALALSWKHGFVRADAHVLGFFTVAMLLALAAPSMFATGRRWGRFELTSLACLGGIWLAEPGLFHITLPLARNKAFDNVAALVTLPSARERFDFAFDRDAFALGLNAVKEKIGDAPVDMLGHEQGRLLLAGLNHHPRPIFQGYKAYTPLLMARNLRFFQSSRAPEYVVAKIQSIDGRFPVMDDALALAEILRRYEVVEEMSDHVLMRVKENQPTTPDFAREMRFVATVPLGQEIEMPADEGKAQWIQIVGYLNSMAKLRSALLRPPALRMVVSELSGRETRHRIVLPAAAEGFIINPLIENSADYAALAREWGPKLVRAIRFEAASPEEAPYWNSVGVRVSTVPDLPVLLSGPETTMMTKGISNRRPERLASEVNTRFINEGSGDEVLVHAPGEIMFDARGAGILSGRFRIMEGAYTGGRHTDGAEFVIEAELADGTSEVVFYRRLTPVEVEADRGMQTFSIDLPDGTVSVTLYTLTGPAENLSWDWTTWSKIVFSDGQE